MAVASSISVADGEISLAGVSHKTLPIELRERLTRLHTEPSDLIRELRDSCSLKEAVVISTCNRFEVIGVQPSGRPDGSLQKFLSGALGVEHHDSNGVYSKRSLEAVRHIFSVASSLDSMVLGEAQILGQVKDGYRRAVECGSAGPVLHQLFQFAFRVAKKVRSNTAIAEKGVSVSYVAVQLARQLFSSLEDRTVMIIGSGRMAELAALHLKRYGCNKIIVANRTIDRATALAERVEGSAISLHEIPRLLPTADIVIGSIAADFPILELQALQRLNIQRPLFLIDLGVPRNFSPELSSLDNIYLYNIDDLTKIANANEDLRKAAAADAGIIVEYGVHQFERWLRKLAAQPEILDFRTRVRDVCESELARTLETLITREQLKTVLPELTHRVSQKISHGITSILSERAGASLDQEALLPLVFDELLKFD